MSRRRPGATLIEVLVGSGMLLVVLGMVVVVFFPAQAYFRQANEVSEMYGDALQALDRMQVEIEEAGPWLVNATGSNPPALALPSARDANNVFRRDSGGTPDWQKWIVYYVASQGSELVLVRKELSGTFPPNPLPYTIPPSALVAPGAGDKIVARNVSLFRVESSPAPEGGIRCIVELTLSRGGTANKPIHTQRFERAAVARNPE